MPTLVPSAGDKRLPTPLNAAQFATDRAEAKRLVLVAGGHYGDTVVIPADLYDRLAAEIDHIRATAPETLAPMYRAPDSPMWTCGVFLMRDDAGAA